MSDGNSGFEVSRMMAVESTSEMLAELPVLLQHNVLYVDDNRRDFWGGFSETINRKVNPDRRESYRLHNG
jgi:hypothetical protein